MISFPPKLGIGRDLAFPFETSNLLKSNQFVKPLPSINEFDLPGIKLDMFKKYNPYITSITEVENKRKFGHQY